MKKNSPLNIVNRLTVFYLLTIPMGLLAFLVLFVLVNFLKSSYHPLGLDVLGKDIMLFFGFASARMIVGLGFGCFYMAPKYFTAANLDAVVFWGPNRSIMNPTFKHLCLAAIITAVCMGIGFSGLYELTMAFVVFQIRSGV